MCPDGLRPWLSRFISPLPVLLTTLMVLALSLTYVMVAYRRDVSPVFPRISDAERPESRVFGLLLSFEAISGYLVVYLRYRLITELNRSTDKVLYNLNLVAFIVGVLWTFGILVVGNFQVTSVLFVHFILAFICLGFMVFYQWIQTILSYRMLLSVDDGSRTCRVRLCLSPLSTLAFISCLSTSIAASVLYRNAYPDALSPLHWSKNTDPGYNYHLISAFFEWIFVILTAAFMLSYWNDFGKWRVFAPIDRSNDNEVVNLRSA